MQSTFVYNSRDQFLLFCRSVVYWPDGPSGRYSFVQLRRTVTHPDSIDSRCDAVLQVELSENVLEMSLDRGGADSQGRSDLFVALGLGHELQHLFLLRCKKSKTFFVITQ